MTEYTYTISYDDGCKLAARKATTATKAIEKLCQQYGWGYRLRQYDADTNGLEWSECLVDRDGGINYSMRMVATRK